MPDPITPASPAGQTIDLEPIVITASPTKTDAAVPVGGIAFDVALDCFDEGDAAAVALLAKSENAPLAALGIGYALGACAAKVVASEEEAASIHRAVNECIDAGGTPLGVVEHTLTCLVVEEQ